MNTIETAPRLTAPAPVDLRRAKDRAHLAFIAHEAAILGGNPAEAEAAKTRFLAASAELKGLHS